MGSPSWTLRFENYLAGSAAQGPGIAAEVQQASVGASAEVQHTSAVVQHTFVGRQSFAAGAQMTACKTAAVHTAAAARRMSVDKTVGGSVVVQHVSAGTVAEQRVVAVQRIVVEQRAVEEQWSFGRHKSKG